jgi:membrane protein YdbS with pleckstrin-like domain
MLPDIINGLFEVLGGLAIFLSIRKLWQDERVQGFHWAHLSFFTAWGFWNLYYYPHLNQWWSFWGGVGVVIANIIYLAMIIYYLRRSK